jgi:hypothetical protein
MLATDDREAAMAEDRMAVLETERNAIAEHDIDLLGERVRVLAHAVMEAEVTEGSTSARLTRSPPRIRLAS